MTPYPFNKYPNGSPLRRWAAVASYIKKSAVENGRLFLCFRMTFLID